MNTEKLMSTALSISSVHMSNDTRLRRVKKPNTPTKKSTAERISIYCAGIVMAFTFYVR